MSHTIARRQFFTSVALIAGASMLAAAPLRRAAARDQAVAVPTGHVLVANQQSASASLIDLATGTAASIHVGDGPHEAVIAPSGRVGVVTIYGLSGAPGSQLAVIDIAQGVVAKTIALGQYTRPHGANFLPGDETRVAVTSETTQNLLIVNLNEGRVEIAIPTNAAGSHMVGITADGARAFTSDVGAGAVSQFDLKMRAFVRVIPTGPRTEGLAVAPDGRTVWAGSNTDGTVTVLDGKTGATIETLKGFSMPYRLVISHDSTLAIVCDAQADALVGLDVSSRQVKWRIDHIGQPRGINIAPDGRFAFVTLATDETMGVIDLATHTIVQRIKVEQSPDGVWYGR
jgi:DNA-binding beta-propeller fold protein YncE